MVVGRDANDEFEGLPLPLKLLVEQAETLYPTVRTCAAQEDFGQATIGTHGTSRTAFGQFGHVEGKR